MGFISKIKRNTTINQIVLEGEKEYIRKMKEMKCSLSDFRKEVEQLNESLRETEKQLRCLR